MFTDISPLYKKDRSVTQAGKNYKLAIGGSFNLGHLSLSHTEGETPKVFTYEAGYKRFLINIFPFFYTSPHCI